MKVYYAHHKMKYNTEIEKYELELIASKMKQEEYIRGNHNEKLLRLDSPLEIINPNGYIPQDISEKEIMKMCLKCISTECDALVFSAINGVIGFGVWQEINEAFATGRKVYYIYKGDIIRLYDFKYKLVDYGRNWKMFASIEV